MPINVQVIDVIKILIQPKCMGPSSSWPLALCTCCTVHCYATGRCLNSS